MNRLAQSIAGWVANHVRVHAKLLEGTAPEYRAVFHGPPFEILNLAFEVLTSEGGCIDAVLANGKSISVPVLLQVEKLQDGDVNPPVGKSGVCDGPFLVALRNAPDCPIYVALVPPGQHSNLSQTSTRSDFGIAHQNNVGTSTIGQWWDDPFIQDLVDGALRRLAWPAVDDREDARRLIEHAVTSADQIDRHEVSRRAAWAVLARVWSSSDEKLTPGTLVSLATGFPRLENGSLDAEGQIEVLKVLASRFEESNFRQSVEQFKSRAESDQERAALDDVLQHFQRKCEAITALSRSMPYYYGPFVGDELGNPPAWWQLLTLERWRALLDEGDGDGPRSKAIHIECLNSIVSQSRGFVPVVLSDVELEISLAESGEEVPISVVRDVGSAKNHREWKVTVSSAVDITDSGVPNHKSPIRYSASTDDPRWRKGSLRVVSLGSWEPGVIVCSRTASKASVPKAPKSSREKVAFEIALVLSGQGRHYLDVYVRPGVVIHGDVAFGSDEKGEVDEERAVNVSKISECEYGFEVDASSECFYQFEIVRPEVGKPEIVRINLNAEEISAQECGSEFERLVLLNCQKEGARRATTDVHVNRQLRCSDLQGWMLAKERNSQSFATLVFALDYASDWRARDWSSRADTVLSKGKFLNDPRPSFQEMQPPEGFVSARAALADRIRGEDGNGLIEAARLGEWLATDLAFGETIEAYVRGYQEWITSSPEDAAWCDISIVTRFESDNSTLIQEPDAILVSPLHPIRLAWHCLAQRALFLAQRKLPCPAAAILDPDCIPDTLVLPLRTAAGGIKWCPFFSVECSSDYWGVLWNASRLDRLSSSGMEPPFDREFGVLVGGVSSGFSVSQVHRALDDVSEMLVAKPVINVMVSSAAGQNNACNEGIISWCREHFSGDDDERPVLRTMGARSLQVLDERKHSRPEDAEISNLAEDTANLVRWYVGVDRTMHPDLGIIAQLETSNAGYDQTKIESPLGIGGLIRGRVRQQLKGGSGAFLSESRMGRARRPSGDGLADKTMMSIALLENLSESRYGYVFAPSVHAIASTLQKAEFAAVSSSAVDPACFLGGWLEGAYLWDYELPSYSNRAGDSNGYYLLSKIKDLDRDTLRSVLARLPGCKDVPVETLDQIVLEVARRGIPTVRGLSGGDSGASGDLGLFVASRLLQDAFRGTTEGSLSLFQIWVEEGDCAQIVLVIPIDPFKGYLEDLTRAVKKPSLLRPDLIVAGIFISPSGVSCKLTPVEVKYRSSAGAMSLQACQDALGQAKSLSSLLRELSGRSDEPEMILWKLAFQHLLSSMLGYGLRVYSQQTVVSNQSARWADHHVRIVEALFSEELNLEIDESGRLIVIDGSILSSPRDCDSDSFFETVVINHADAAAIVQGTGQNVFAAIRERINSWNMLPSGTKSIDANVKVIEAHPYQESKVDGESSVVEAAGTDATTRAGVDSGGSVLQIVPPAQPGISGSTFVEAGANPIAVATQEIGAEVCGVNLLVGETIDGFKQESRYLNLSNTNLNQLNIGVVGDLGTGKTQLLKSLIFQIARSAKLNGGIQPRILIFDYKKDYSSDDFVKAVGARVVRPQHLPFNLFDTAGAGDSMAPWLDRFKFFSDVLDKIYSGVGPVQRTNLKRAVRQAYDQCELQHRQPNIYDVHFNYQAILGTKADSVSAIIEDLVDMEMFSPDTQGIASFDKFLDGVVVVSLDALGQDDRTKNMLVAIMLNMFYEHMLRIQKRPYVGENKELRIVDSFLLVDEADNIMRYEFDVLRKILLQGREFGVGVVLASQYLRHFKAGATDYREPLLSWFIHKVPNVTPQELGALGLTNNVAALAERIKSLSLHECLFKSHDIQGDIVKGAPFYRLTSRPEYKT